MQFDAELSCSLTHPTATHLASATAGIGRKGMPFFFSCYNSLFRFASTANSRNLISNYGKWL